MILFAYVTSKTSDAYSWYVVNARNPEVAHDFVECQASQVDFDSEVDIDLMDAEEAIEMNPSIEGVPIPDSNSVIRFDYGT